MSLTLEEVRRVRFRMAKRNVTGYEVGDVDTFIDKVEESFAQFENERELLRREAESLRSSDDVGHAAVTDQDQAAKDAEIAALRAEVDRLNAEAADASAAGDAAEPGAEDDGEAGRLRGQLDQVQARNDELRSELDRVRSELDEVRTARVNEVAGQVQTLTVGTRDDASPAVIRLVQLATEQAEQLVEEASAEAARKLDDAKQQSQEIITDARTQAERVESEAEARAQQLETETAERRTQLLTDLEREQSELSHKVDALRGFEASYRDNLRSYLNKHISMLDEDTPEPVDVPELATRKDSDTPRLDALAQGRDH